MCVKDMIPFSEAKLAKAPQTFLITSSLLLSRIDSTNLGTTPRATNLSLLEAEQGLY